MTVQSKISKIQYNGNGSTTAFSTSFSFQNNEDVTVILTSNGTDIVKTIISDYTITGAGTELAGTVTMLTAPAAGERLTILRDPPITQLTDYVESDSFPAEAHERALDKLTHICQRLNQRVDNSLQLSDTQLSTISAILPTPIAGLVLGWNDDGTALVNKSTVPQLADDVVAASVTAPEVNTQNIKSANDLEIAPNNNLNISISALNALNKNLELILKLSSDGNLTIKRQAGGEILSLIDEGAATADLANPIITFNRAETVGGAIIRLGYVGFGSSSNDDIYVFNDNAGGNIVLNHGVGGNILAGNGTLGTVWHSENDGAGSGLNADLLDGIQASSFSQISTPSWTPVLYDGAGNVISTSEVVSSVYRVGNIVYCRYYALAGTAASTAIGPYLSLPTFVSDVQNLGLCFSTYSTNVRANANIEDQNATAYTMVARGSAAYIKDYIYDAIGGTLFNNLYILASFSYRAA